MQMCLICRKFLSKSHLYLEINIRNTIVSWWWVLNKASVKECNQKGEIMSNFEELNYEKTKAMDKDRITRILTNIRKIISSPCYGQLGTINPDYWRLVTVCPDYGYLDLWFKRIIFASIEYRRTSRSEHPVELVLCWNSTNPRSYRLALICFCFWKELHQASSFQESC